MKRGAPTSHQPVRPSPVADPIVVVGGGITGLAAAYELTKQGHEPLLLEAGPRVGGKLHTTEHAGQFIDEAADAFLARVPWGRELAEELNLADRLVSPAAREASIWSAGTLHPLPSPNVLGIPLDPESARGGLLSDAAVDALHADMERTDPDPLANDDTIGSVVRRRLGNEVFEKLINPLLGAINAADCDRLSVHSSAPQIAAAAAANPSLIRGLLELRGTPDPDAPVFYSFRNGMGTFIHALTDVLGHTIRTEAPVSTIEHVKGRLRLTLVSGEPVTASACVLAAPAWAAGPMVRMWPSAATAMESIEFVSVAMVTLTYRADDVPQISPHASGFLVPHHESPLITACSFASSKWAHLAGDQVTLRVSLGHAGADAVVKAGDADIVPVVRGDLNTILGIDAEPTHVRVSRWPRSFPQYGPGHVDLVATIDEELSPSGIFAAGASIAGIGIPACINQGRTAARESADYVTGLDSAS